MAFLGTSLYITNSYTIKVVQKKMHKY